MSKTLQTEPIQPGITGQNILSAVTVYIFEGRAKRARDVYWAKYNGDSPDDPDNPDNPDDPVNKGNIPSNMYSMMGKIAMPIHRLIRSQQKRSH